MTIHVGHFNNNALVTTLADLSEAVWTCDLPVQTRQNIKSSIKTVGRVLGEKPEDIAANIEELLARLVTANPAAAGIGAVRWSNVKSDLKRALKLIPGAAQDIALSDGWLAVVALARNPADKSTLRRFARFCIARGLEPQGVSDDDLDAFTRHLASVEHSKTPERIADDVARLWNRIAVRHPDLALGPLSVESRSRAYVLPWPDFPPSLQTDVMAYCSPSSIESLFDIDHVRRSFSKATAAAYENKLRRLASAHVLAGVPIEALTSLREMVTPSTLQKGLAWLAERNGGKPNVQLHNLAELSRNIARHWAKLDEADIAIIEVWAKRFRPRRGGMTEKNRERLRQFTGGDMLSALVNLPEMVFAELKGTPVTRAGAGKARDAVMLALFTIAPMRLKNMRHLDRQKHFRPAFSLGANQWELVIGAADVKNDIDLAYPVPPHVMAMVEHYLAVYQPLLSPRPSTLLFPGSRGRDLFSENGARRALGGLLKERLGLAMNPHLFRHLGAYIFLKANPGQHESVRQLLGHKSIQTTIDFYASFETDEAMKRYGTVLGDYRFEQDED